MSAPFGPTGVMLFVVSLCTLKHSEVDSTCSIKVKNDKNCDA